MRLHLRKVLTIAKYEFLVTVTRKTYLFAVLGFPASILLTLVITVLALKNNQFIPTHGSVALVDNPGIVDLNLQTSLEAANKHAIPPFDNDKFKVVDNKRSASNENKFIPYDNIDQALAALKKKIVLACYIVEPDYLTTGKVTVITPENSLPTHTRDHQDYLVNLIRASLSKERLSGQKWDRFLTPAIFENKTLLREGTVKPEADAAQIATSFALPIFLCVILTMNIYMSSGYLLRSVTLEKQNRVIEVLLSSIEPIELLTGKILGLGAAGILQAVAYMALGLPALPFMIGKGVGWLILSLIYMVLGYILIAILMATTGIIANCEREGNQLASIWVLPGMFPLIMLLITAPSAESWAMRILFLFPLTGPTTMIYRIGLDKVTATDIFLSIASLVISIYLAMKAAAKIFRVASLLYGKRPTVPEIFRWLKEA